MDSDLTLFSTPSEHAYGVILTRAHPPGIPDSRNSDDLSPSLAAFFAAKAPLTARLEAFGNFPDSVNPSWSRAPGPGGRYQAGTTQGGVYFGPPDQGVEYLYAGVDPPASPMPHFTLWGSKLAFGRPLKTGLTGRGFTQYLNTSTQLVVDAVSASGALASQALLLDSGASTAKVFGSRVVTTAASSAGNVPVADGAGGFAWGAGGAASTSYNAVLANTSSAITTTETVVLSTPAMPAGTLAVGTGIRVTINGQCGTTAADTVAFRLRLGAAGTTADQSIVLFGSTTVNNGGSLSYFKLVVDLVVRTTGATGTGGSIWAIFNTGVTGIQNVAINMGSANATNVNTTLANAILSLTAVTSAATTEILVGLSTSIQFLS